MSAKRGMMVAVPTTGRLLPFDWGWSLAQMRWPMNVDLRWEQLPDREVADARCTLAERARVERVKWLYFQDEDVVPPVNAVKLLVEAMDCRPRAAVVSGVYTDKHAPEQPMVFNEPGNGPYWDWTVGDVFPVGFGTGMGCALINVELLDQIERPWFVTVETERESWTEDLWFCERVQQAGLQVWVHGGVLCRHFDLTTGQAHFLPTTSKPFINYYARSANVTDKRTDPGNPGPPV